MKDFIKWLGINEKVAKVVVYLAIIMGFLILTNAMLASLGFPNYQITAENLKQIKMNVIGETISGWIVTYLNFWSIILIIFRPKEIKKIFKYSLIYLILNIMIMRFTNEAILQLFIIGFVIVFSYLYSNKNKKYILYSALSIIINIVVQGITYVFKAKLINFNELGYTTQAILSIDYFIIMAMIIFVKEIYLKKRGEKLCQHQQEDGADTVYSGSENSKKKQSLQKK